MDYEYQLVLQISEGCSLTSVDVEDDIAAAIGNSRDDKSLPHFVDGNAMGSGTIEFFLHTNNPLTAFELTKPPLASEGLIDYVTAAYCRLSGSDFSVIWPLGCSGDFIV